MPDVEWQPFSRLRHAFPRGECDTVTALCGARLVIGRFADDDVIDPVDAWLWPTCRPCWDQATHTPDSDRSRHPQ